MRWGKQAGLVLNPATPLDILDYLIDDLDLILVMSVNPGFGGQSFIDSQLRKIENIRQRIEDTGKDIRLEVDGGIDQTTAPTGHCGGCGYIGCRHRYVQGWSRSICRQYQRPEG